MTSCKHFREVWSGRERVLSGGQGGQGAAGPEETVVRRAGPEIVRQLLPSREAQLGVQRALSPLSARLLSRGLNRGELDSKLTSKHCKLCSPRSQLISVVQLTSILTDLQGGGVGSEGREEKLPPGELSGGGD